MSSQSATIAYRKLAFDHYERRCAWCGFGIEAVLEVAHLDCNHSNNAVENLVILCPTCHRMHDLDLISTDLMRLMRDGPKTVKWSKLMKDAGQKAAWTRKWKQAGRKAAATRRKNLEPKSADNPSN